MKTFDDLLEQHLQELSLTGIGHAIDNKVGVHAANKFLSGLGSKSAAGRVALRQTVMKISAGWRQYCAEQQIRDPKIEDVIDYLKVKVGIDPSPAMATKFAYGHASEGSDQQPEIDQAISALDTAIHANDKPDQTVYDSLRKFGEADIDTQIATRQGLFALYRNNQASARYFAPVRDLIGGRDARNSQLINNLFVQVAKAMLKTGKGQQQKATGADQAKPTMGRANSEYHTGDKAARDLFFKDIGIFKITPDDIKRASQFVAADKAIDNSKLLMKKLKVLDAVRISALFLQLFSGKYFKVIEPIIAEYEKAKPGSLAAIKKIQEMMNQPYETEKVDEQLYSFLKQWKSDDTRDVFQFLTMIMAAAAAK